MLLTFDMIDNCTLSCLFISLGGGESMPILLSHSKYILNKCLKYMHRCAVLMYKCSYCVFYPHFRKYIYIF